MRRRGRSRTPGVSAMLSCRRPPVAPAGETRKPQSLFRLRPRDLGSEVHLRLIRRSVRPTSNPILRTAGPPAHTHVSGSRRRAHSRSINGSSDERKVRLGDECGSVGAASSESGRRAFVAAPRRRGCAAATLIDMHQIGDALRRAVVPALAVFTAFLLGAVVIVLTDFEHLQQIGSDPLAAIGGALAGVIDGYPAIVLRGDRRPRSHRGRDPER